MKTNKKQVKTSSSDELDENQSKNLLEEQLQKCLCCSEEIVISFSLTLLINTAERKT